MKILFLIFIFFAPLAFGELIIDDSQKKYDSFTASYYHDEDASLTIDSIQKIPFTKKISNQFSEGYHNGVAWIKIEIHNKSSNENFILAFAEPIWTQLDLYYMDATQWKVKTNGLNVPIKLREIQDNFPAFKLTLSKNQKHIVYLRGHTVSGHIGQISILTQDEYFNPSRFTIAEAYILLIFVIATLIIVNLYNLVVTKDKIYIFYILYVCFVIAFISMKSATYLLFDFNGWKEGLHTIGALMMTLLLFFSQEFLQLKKHLPFVNKVFYLFGSLFLVFAFLIALNIQIFSLIFNITSSIFLVVLFITTFKLFTKGDSVIRYYLIALSFYTITMGLMVLNFNALIPNTNISRYSYLFGLLIELIFFTLILTHRFVEANRQRIFAQNNLLAEQHNNEAKLKAEIAEQTKELSDANDLLRKQKRDLETAQQKLLIESTIDPLSQLYNRRYFFEIFNKCFYTAHRYDHNLSLIMLDLDHFKKINDDYGHLFGDDVIRYVSNLFKSIARESDTVARYGGEEFAILLPETNKEDAILIAQRIRQDIEEKASHDLGIKHTITLSAGVSQLHETDDKIELMISRADEALYEAKNTGRNKVCCL